MCVYTTANYTISIDENVAPIVGGGGGKKGGEETTSHYVALIPFGNTIVCFDGLQERPYVVSEGRKGVSWEIDAAEIILQKLAEPQHEGRGAVLAAYII